MIVADILNAFKSKILVNTRSVPQRASKRERERERERESSSSEDYFCIYRRVVIYISDNQNSNNQDESIRRI